MLGKVSYSDCFTPGFHLLYGLDPRPDLIGAKFAKQLMIWNLPEQLLKFLLSNVFDRTTYFGKIYYGRIVAEVCKAVTQIEEALEARGGRAGVYGER